MAVPTTSTTHGAPSGHTSRFSLVTVVALLAAAAVAAGGILHFLLWDERYRTAEQLPGEIPGAWVVKTGFPVNGALSIVLAGALIAFAFGLVVRIGRLAILAAIALEIGSIVALVMSRRERGFFKWVETGWDADAKQILYVEIVAVVLLVATLVLDMRRTGLPAE